MVLIGKNITKTYGEKLLLDNINIYYLYGGKVVWTLMKFQNQN